MMTVLHITLDTNAVVFSVTPLVPLLFNNTGMLSESSAGRHCADAGCKGSVKEAGLLRNDLCVKRPQEGEWCCKQQRDEK